MEKYVEIIGPCSKWIEGKGWVIQVPMHLLEEKGFKKVDDKLIDVIKHCLHKNDPCYNCENCVKGPEQDVILTCRSILKEIIQLFNKEE